MGSPYCCLPQTGSEASVERLMKQISSFMSEISDEFKTIVVEAIRSVCVKFPRKHHILMTFLSSMLREEGGFEYKRAIVCTIITIIEENPDAKESGFFPSSPPPYPSSYIHTHTHTHFSSLSLFSFSHSLDARTIYKFAFLTWPAC